MSASAFLQGALNVTSTAIFDVIVATALAHTLDLENIQSGSGNGHASASCGFCTSAVDQHDWRAYRFVATVLPRRLNSNPKMGQMPAGCDDPSLSFKANH